MTNNNIPSKAKIRETYESYTDYFTKIMENIISILHQKIILQSQPTYKNRVKSFSSYYKKVLRLKPEDAAEADGIVCLTDMIGIRMICAFLEDINIALEQIKKLNLEQIINKNFSDLSGGQQQRVLLARALCAAKDLLVLDEPVTGLDPLVTDELYSIIRKLNKEENLSVLMVSHDVHRAVQNATHILHMNNSPLFFGTAQEYQKSKLYNQMSNVEVCETHLCTHCGSGCNATHIHLPGDYSHD